MAKTAEDLVTIRAHEQDDLFHVDFHYTGAGGDFWNRWTYYGGEGEGAVLGSVTLLRGFLELAQPGFFRAELEAAGLADHVLAEISLSGDPLVAPGVKVSITQRERFVCPSPAAIFGVADSGGGSAPGWPYTLLTWTPICEPSASLWRVVQWDPAGASARRLAPLAVSEEYVEDATIASANQTAALVVVTQYGDYDVRYVTHLVTSEEDIIFEGDLSGRYQLLPPNLLMNMETQTLHRISAGLEPVGSLPPLAPGGPAAGEYHVVGQPRPQQAVALAP